MRILIVGAGIGGLALAAFLKKRGLKPELVERAHAWRDIGYAVQLWENGRELLKELDLYDEIARQGWQVPYLSVTDKTGRSLTRVDLVKQVHLRQPVTAIERSKLHCLLRHAASGVPTELGTTVIDVKQAGGEVAVTFSDGRRSLYDLVVGSDGIRSELRDSVFRPGYVHYYEWAVWMDWIPMKTANTAIAMLGQGKIFGCYPVSADKYCATFFLPIRHGLPETRDHRVAMLHKQFKDFRGVAPAALQALDHPVQVFHDDLSYVNMHEWYKGRIALIGDAEHAVSPLSGMGCSMAIEDAYVMASLLAKAGAADIPDVLARFAQLRQPRIDMVKRQSKILWDWFCTESPVACSVRNAVLPVVPHSFLAHNITKLLSSPLI